ncbi:MAG: DUF1501 domain-containing protein [Gemmataceae bacterium]|nr:DUF1501 domain-containing protein [Gemmataceae bacterium]MDW8265628.1 DUF1501 domain-containing protein [Gemmataceae bacterium]
MLTIHATDRHRYCDGLSRRSFLQAGILGATGLTLADGLRAQAAAQDRGSPTRETALILIWLDGGPTHMDTYDLKPSAPAEYRGPMKAIPTNVPGVAVCELMPRQARIMDRLTIVRSLHHTTGDHFAGAHWMLTGYFGSNVARLDPMYPSAGAITAKVRGANRPGMPAYVAVPVAASVGLVPGYHGGAYLGTAYNPFQTGGDPNTPNFSVRNLTLPGGLTLSQLEDRRRLLASFDSLRREIDASGTADTLDRFQQEAYELISGPAARQAFDIGREDPRVRDRYGRHIWGQSCLLARRLVEAGVTFVTVHMGGWDNHAAIEAALKNKLPIFDRALASLVEDLDARGLYERVAICVCGEFGRTPKVNGNAGRDHWGEAGFAVVGGGGLRTGGVVGATTDKGEYPKDCPVRPEDLWATLYAVLGIDTRQTFVDKTGRPHPVLNGGQPIPGLL